MSEEILSDEMKTIIRVEAERIIAERENVFMQAFRWLKKIFT